MRSLCVANVICAGKEEVALQCDGTLLSVAALEDRLRLETSPTRFTDARDFKSRVFSLNMAGLRDILACLDPNNLPADAILPSSRCVYLPPTLPTAAILEFDPTAPLHAPRFQRGYARCLRGHNAPLPVPADDRDAQFAVYIAAVLGEDLRDASPDEARHAIVGYTTASLWNFPSRNRVSPGWGQYRLGQLGPALIELPSFDGDICLQARIRVSGRVVDTPRFESSCPSFGELISFACQGTSLVAGDVIMLGPLTSLHNVGNYLMDNANSIVAEIDGFEALAGVLVPVAAGYWPGHSCPPPA